MRPGDGGRSALRRPRAFAAILLSVIAGVTFSTERAAARGTTATGFAVAESAKRRLVSVKIAGDRASVAAVLDVLRERTGGTETDTELEVVPTIDRASIVTPGPPNERQLARIWIDLREPAGRANEREPVTLYVVDGPWERVLVRPVTREANPEVTWEEIGHIVELALGALRAGESIGVGRAVAREQLLPTPEPPPPPPPAPEKRPPAPVPTPRNPWRPHVRAGAFYSVSSYGPGLELASGPGAVLQLHSDSGRLDFGTTLTAEYRFPSTVDRGAAVVTFEGGALHVMASSAYSFDKRHQLSLGIGGGIELVNVTGASTQLETLRFVDGDLDVIPAARLLTRYSHATSTFRVFAGAGVDLTFRNLRYLLSRGDDSLILFEPWVARPFLLLGIETN